MKFGKVFMPPPGPSLLRPHPRTDVRFGSELLVVFNKYIIIPLNCLCIMYILKKRILWLVNDAKLHGCRNIYFVRL